MGINQSMFLLLLRLWAHVSPLRRMQLAGLGCLMLVGTFAEIASLGMALPFLGALTAPSKFIEHPWVQPIVSSLGIRMPDQLLIPLTALFCLTALFSGATRLGLLWAQTRLGNAIGNDIGSKAYKRTLHQPYAVHLARNSSDIVAAMITKVNTVIYFIVIPLLNLIASIFIILTIICFMILVDPETTLLAFLGFGLIYLIIAYSSKTQLALNSQRVTVGQNKVAKIVQEGLGGIRDVLIDGLQETYYRIYSRTDWELRRALANIAILGGAPRPIIESVGLVLIGLLVFVLANRQEDITSSIPIIGALALAAQRILPLVQQGYSSWTSMVGGRASLNDVLMLLEQQLPTYCVSSSPLNLSFEKEISVSNLHFRYSSETPWILKKVYLQIPRGSRMGFIGTSGSGKSTLLDIIMGLLTPSIGEIRVDGALVDDTNCRAWQSHIAHVPQTVFLVDATISENIAFGVSLNDIDRERVRDAAKRAHIADDIESWPLGYDTVVGERGVRLSGGQRQRIGIARALYKQADVIVFDEATSALDTDTESLVMKSIYALYGELTILIVAHRLSTLRNCDCIVELENGQVKRVGSYENMVNTPDNIIQKI